MTIVLHAPRALLPSGWARDVRVSIGADGRIASVASGTAPGPGDLALADEVLMPAPTNLHSHTFQRAMAGLTEFRSGPEGDDFWSWRSLMYRFLDAMTPEEIEAVAAFAFVEMLEGGFAACTEFHYLHNAPGGAPYSDPAELPGRICRAAAETGIGLTLLPVHYVQGGVDGRPLAGGQLRFRTGRDSFAAILDGAAHHLAALPADAVLGVAPHSLRAVPPADVAWAAGLRPAGPVHIHAAEQTGEVAEVVAGHGARPVELLLDLGAAARWCLIHATHMTEEETRRLAASGAVAGLCPITESSLGDGIFPAASFLARGGRLGIGTDSNLLIDVAAELRTLEYSQRLRDRSRAILVAPGRSCGRFLWETAAAGGAQAAGREAGAIAPGLWADLLSVDATAPGLASRGGDFIPDSLIFARSALRPRRVWSAGRVTVEDGRALARDGAEARYRRALARLLAV
jgi:formimidoylglutamate deiminase